MGVPWLVVKEALDDEPAALDALAGGWPDMATLRPRAGRREAAVKQTPQYRV